MTRSASNMPTRAIDRIIEVTRGGCTATLPDDMEQAEENKVEDGARGKAKIQAVDRLF